MTSATIQKYKNYSHPQLIKEAEKRFNAYIRSRDDQGGYFTCISCGIPKKIQGTRYHAGHFLSAGHHSYTRFNENNVHGQCDACNLYLSGNLIKYRINLVKKIGEDSVKELEAFGSIAHKWDRLELIAIIEEYKSKLKQAA